MINLLPTETKEQIAYARRNTLLSRWCIAVIIAIAGIFALIGAGSLYLNQAAKAQASEVEDAREQLRVQKLDATQARVNEISGNLKLAAQVLQRQILFSGLIQQIASAVPSGASLTDLRITKLQGGIDLEFEAKDYQTATQIQVNLQDKANKIFEKADIISIDCNGTIEEGGYPCRVTVRALFTKDNPYVLVPSSSGGSQ